MTSAVRVGIVGGGMSGLSTAYYLEKDLGDDVVITLFEAEDRTGGKIKTQELTGLPVETGPDAFLSRSPTLAELLKELGLSDQVVGPAASGAYVLVRGKLRLLPPATMFGVPEKLYPLLKSGMLSLPGTARAGWDLVAPASKHDGDVSVGELLRPRFGNEVVDNLVDPLVGGVHAGSVDVLSAQSAVPEVMALIRGKRSLYFALRERRSKAAPPSGPALVTLRDGMHQLPDRLRAALKRTELRTGVAVTNIERSGAEFIVTASDGSTITVDRVVLTTPAYVTADLIDPIAPGIATVLREIEYVSVANVTFAFNPDELAVPGGGTGFLVPPVAKEFIVGCTWLTAKWAQLQGKPHVLIRALVGRYGDDRHMSMSDDELADRVYADLVRIGGINGKPLARVIQRWPRAMAQYTVGHAKRLELIDAELQTLPGVHLTGAAYRGVGLAACALQAKNTAAAIARETHPELTAD